jgi:hypothetical protein
MKLAGESTGIDTMQKTLMPFLAPLQPLGGVIKFDVKDGEGATFYADLERGALSLLPLTPTVIVRGYIRDLTAFLSGELSAEAGLITGRIGLSGEASTLFRLAAILREQTKRDGARA